MQTTLIIRKATKVWVGKDLTSKSLTLFQHTMKRDLTVPYPTEDEAEGPKVIALSRDVESIRQPKLMMLKMFEIANTPHPKGNASMLELLEAGYDIFVTDHETYPLLVVHSDHVDEADDTEWHVEDLGDGLSVHRKIAPGTIDYYRDDSI